MEQGEERAHPGRMPDLEARTCVTQAGRGQVQFPNFQGIRLWLVCDSEMSERPPWTCASRRREKQESWGTNTEGENEARADAKRGWAD